MLKFSICVPDATINYIQNPTLRYDTTGWTAQGSAISRVLTRSRFGVASLKVVTTGAVLREGAFYRVSNLSGVNEPITVSAYVRGNGQVRIRMDNNVVGGTEFSSDSVQLRDDRWTRISVSGFSTGGNDLRLFVETNEANAVIRTFYIDGAQLERKAYMTTYCDGDQPGCRWDGTYHGSISRRSANTRAGGKWVQLAGDERVQQDLYMTVVGGLGVAPLTNNTQNYALAPGGYYQNTKILTRPITMTFFAKHVVNDTESVISLSALHQLRQFLIDTVKPDKTEGGEDIWFEYIDGDTLLYFQARYDGGLEGEWDIRNQFVNSFPLRLLMVSPMIHEDSQNVSVLDFQDSQTGNNFVVGRINSLWSKLNSGVNSHVYCMAQDTRGRIYVAGAFTVANNNASAINPLIPAVVAYWDGEKWNSIATSFNGTFIAGIAISPTGDIYITGDFTIINGVAANRVAKWNGTTWSALGTGLNSFGQAITVAPNGDVYVGGNFTTAGGVTCNYIARWDGLTWRRVGQFGGFNALCYSIAISKDGNTLYAGGQFTTEFGGGLTLNYIAKYNMTTGTFSAMGSGFNNYVRALLISPNGDLYAGGYFTASGSTTVNLTALWNGSIWTPLGSGITGTADLTFAVGVLGLSIFQDGRILAVGNFTQADNHPANRVALWNGSVWTAFDLNLESTNTGYGACCAITLLGDVFIGFSAISATVNVLTPGFTTFTNPGTAEAQPFVYIVGPGSLRWLENQSTGKRLYLDMTVLQNEEVFIDCKQGTIYSTIRGDLSYTLLRGSDFLAFQLLPGDNLIACLMVNDVNAQMQIGVQPLHWSIDATENSEVI